MGQFRSKPEIANWRDEVKTVAFRQAVVAEFIATFIFLFSTIGCVVFTQDGGISTARQLQVSLIFGNAITILVFIFAGVSGANINPAVSWGLFVAGKISWVRCLAYTWAQVLGAVCGTGFVRIMTPALFDKVDGGANNISKNATAKEALGVEFGCTFLLVLTVMAAVDNIRARSNQHLPTIAPICIGMAVTAAHFVAIPVDNCSINPARSFGTSAISGNWNDHAVFWFGPYFGATAAALMWMFLFHHPDAAAEAASKGAVQLKDEAAAAPAALAAGAAAPALSASTVGGAPGAAGGFVPAYSYGGHVAAGSPEAPATFTGTAGGSDNAQVWR
jgi:aquaporin PIP